MKKLSVLLVIGLFCIPMMVYGFTKTGLPSVISNSISKGYHAIVTIASRSQNRSTSLIQPQADTVTLASENPFFKEPSGAKGVVASVDSEKRSAFLKDAVYFDPATETLITADLTIYMDDSTEYYMDLNEGSNFTALVPGSTVICNGPIDFQTKEMKFAYDVYMGRFIPEDTKSSLTFTAPIKDFDSNNRTFAFDYPGSDGQIYTIQVSVTDETQVISYTKDAPDSPKGPEGGKIPSFVKEGTLMSGVFIINQDITAVANLVNFYEH